jgi:ferredoxin-NADP reductase
MQYLFRKLDKYLNMVTPYQLLSYGLSAIIIIAVILAFLHKLPQSALAIIIDTAVLCATCYVVNKLFAIIADANTNYESWFITALIIVLITNPYKPSVHAAFLVALYGVVAMASKYILVYRKHHLFNPAAIAALILGLTKVFPAIWWVGSPALFIPVVIYAFLVLRKTRRFEVFGVFFIMALATAIFVGLANKESVGYILHSALFSSPLIFFGSVMFTEPETMPIGMIQQITYGIIAGVLISSELRIGIFSATPELALIVANIYSNFASPKQTIVAKLKSIKELVPHTFELALATDRPLKFEPGQYLTMNFRHEDIDLRGTRRSFSIASAPSGDEVLINFKQSLDGRVSSFKKVLLKMQPGEKFSITSVAGNFTAPGDQDQKIALIAGGIGITPFLSMIRGQVNDKAKRDVVVLYFVNDKNELCFSDLWQEAQVYGVKMIPVYAKPSSLEAGALSGRLDAEAIKNVIKDYNDRIFYVSGPSGFVDGYKNDLIKAGVPRRFIHKDHFSGY